MKKHLLTLAIMLVALVASSQKSISNHLNEIDLENHLSYVPKDFKLKSNIDGVYHYENNEKQFIAFVFNNNNLQCVRTGHPSLVMDLKNHDLKFSNIKIDNQVVEVVWRRGRLIVRHNGKWNFYTKSFIDRQL